ncbi:C4-dicarboxylate ABC transporter [Oceanicola sp. 22II-s10i]|uniref:SLAC1 anion channel family protein n=1 Tax=Oceanicola sp. 22II-s10i TaxID=1317116 RepID=UPI000B525404|nr:SLAC1 anion channel family protein [Oceanicola sp. 22II-s10i]OWU86819.1 C4-dicarboxylate ABC transporter [Oceanicola sp. 22II-s10i]
MTEAAEIAHESGLQHYPVSFFAVSMGLAGLTLALHAGEAARGWSGQLSGIAGVATVLVFAAIALGYLAKAMLYPQAVRAEWHHPVRLAFFPAISISLLLIAAVAVGRDMAIAPVIWMLGAAGQFVLTLAVVSGWIGTRAFQQGALNPAWFIPAVGNVIAPLAGVPLGFVELSWYFFSVGVLFWIVLLTLVMNRMIFHDPLPGRLQPTLVILIAPPAVAFVAWLRLTGEVDAFARILVNGAWFFALVVATQVPKLMRLPFALSFWALSFPLAALTVATLTYGARIGSTAHEAAGLVLLGLLVLVIAGLVLRTLRAMSRGEICVPE